MSTKGQDRFSLHIQRYMITGVLTLVPLWITWVVFDFILRQLSKLGMPWVRALSKTLEKVKLQQVPAKSKSTEKDW